jgi:effector-binding domain-containing protein
VREEPARTVAYLRHQGPYAAIPDVLQDLMKHLERARLTPAGAPTVVFFTDPQKVPAAQARWEAQVPVAQHHPDEEPGEDGVGVRSIHARSMAVLIHTGPYDAVAPAYGHAARWIDQHGYKIVGPPEEAYLSEPDAPPEKIRTEIRFPVAHAPVSYAT